MKMVLNRKVAGLVLALLGAGCALPAGEARQAAPVPETGVWVEREAYLMGTRLRVALRAADREAGLRAGERVFAEVRRLEDVLSSWRPDTEIGRINAAPVGEAVRVSAELWRLLDEARLWSERSGGAFDPAVGALIDAWDLRGSGRRPGPGELDAARSATGLDRFRFGAGTVTRLSAGAWLDTGGFGKGAALRAVVPLLREQGVSSALLDFGGQVLAVGAGPEGEGWEIAVAHPSRRVEPAAKLRLRDRSASTTSQSERWVEAAGARVGHVVDPRTGQPVPPWGSVTVVAEDAALADALSTALLVMGPERGRRWAEGLGEVGVLFLEERGGEVVPSWNSAMRRYLVNF